MTYPRYIPKPNLLATWVFLVLKDLALLLLSCVFSGHGSSHVVMAQAM